MRIRPIGFDHLSMHVLGGQWISTWKWELCVLIEEICFWQDTIYSFTCCSHWFMLHSLSEQTVEYCKNTILEATVYSEMGRCVWRTGKRSYKAETVKEKLLTAHMKHSSR